MNNNIILQCEQHVNEHLAISLDKHPSLQQDTNELLIQTNTAWEIQSQLQQNLSFQFSMAS